MRTTVGLVAAVALLSTSACATYLDDLNRAETHYAANEHERALALFRVLEPDLDSLRLQDRARYAYLRGMNDYRLGKPFRADARHWLAIAKAIEREQPGSLSSDWKTRLEEALRDLNQDIYGVGVFPEEPQESGNTESARTSSTDSDKQQTRSGSDDESDSNESDESGTNRARKRNSQ